MLERLQKIISAAGVTSRRAAEELIREGRVRVNGTVVTELGTKADASKDHIKVDGKLINPQQPPTYLMLNKPAGFVTTMSDPEGRPTVQDLLKGVKTRVYPVGRLDYNTEGLLLMTNDGDFAHLITHPKHEFPKTYLAKVKGILDERQIALLENGMYLQDGRTAPAKVRKIRKEEANSWVEITIHEGRKRQVRRMFDHVGRSVIRLKRVRTGTLALGDLAEGTFRHLTPAEVKGLLETALKTDDGDLKPRAARPDIKRPEPQARPAGAKRTASRVATSGEKKAHKGRMPDLRPWRREETGGKGPAGAASRGDRGLRAGSSFTRGDKRPRPSFGAGAGRPTTGPSNVRPKSAVPAWKTDARRKPGTVRPEGRSSAFGRGTQGEARRPGAGVPAWKTDASRKSGTGRPAGRSSSPRSSTFGRGTQGETRRPSAKPRPNKSTFSGRKGPARGSRPGPKGRGQGAGPRGPRR
jgi:23S rRNA pseudouridine2605 synthase